MRVLVTQGAMHRVAGSEMVAAELVEYLSGRGDEVIVATHGFSAEWHERLTSFPGVRIFGVTEPTLDELLAERAPDVAWIHHQTIPIRLLREPRNTVFVFHHMSPFHPAEFPVSFAVETALAGRIAFPSPESLDVHKASPLLRGVEESRLVVFGNPAPERFAVDEPAVRTALSSILVVSNHIPDDLASAIDALRDRGIRVDVFGEQADLGARWVRVEPEDVRGHDAVITIGKTVQYAIVSGVPVFCYDYLGGPGWLSDDNFDLARYHNFSGRGFDRRAPDVLVEEIVDGFEDAAAFALRLHRDHRAEFLVGERLREVLDGAGPAPEPVDDREIAAFEAKQETIGIYMIGLVESQAEARGLRAAVVDRDARLGELERRIGEVERQLETVERDRAALAARLASITSHPAVRAYRRARRIFRPAAR